MKKGFGVLLSDSFREYFDKFVPILKVFLLLYILPLFIFLIIIIALIFSFLGTSFLSGMAISDFNALDIMEGAISASSSLIIIFIPIIIILFIALIVFYLLATLAFLQISFSKNKNISFREAFRGGAKYFWPYLGLTLLLALALFGLFLLLIIPGIIFMVYWFFSPYILFNENKGIVDSMKSSKAIVKGRWWRTFGYIILICLITGGISIVLDFIPFMGRLLSNLFVIPFTIIFFKNFYLDMKNNKK